MKSKLILSVIVFCGVVVLTGLTSRADTTDKINTVQSEAQSVTEEGQKSASAPLNSQDDQNNRMKTLQGSSSRWSGQFNMTYSGSSVSGPFSADAPNPGNQVPPPMVSLAGTMSARYRLNGETTMGLGTGITTQTPFQGPKNTSIADPYVDVARSYKVGPIQNRADIQATLWTNNQYFDQYGYRCGATALNESFMQFKFGLTVGLVLQLDYNLFASGVQYDSSQQTQYDFYTDPFAEFKLSKRFNLRSVLGIGSLHNLNQSGAFSFYHPQIYQTFGVGISVVDAVFFYPFIEFFPFSGALTSQSSLVGFNAIVNLF